MTNYAIMRCEKVKSMGQLSRSLKHNFREQETPNADPNRTDQNEHDGAERTTEAMGAVRERLPEKRRKDAVIAVEYMMTASPEWFEQHKGKPDFDKAFFDRSKQWLEKKYGKENVVLTSIHRDEKTPHMSAWVTPITEDGRLCAKDFIGGPAKLRADQTSYHKSLGQLGLTRGIEGSKATHERIQTFYSRIQPEGDRDHEKRFKSPQISSQDIKPRKVGLVKRETSDQVVNRINSKSQEAWREAGLTQAIRGYKVKEAVEQSQRLQQSNGKLRKKADQMDGFLKRLNTMKEQGIKAPDGREFDEFVLSEIKKSRELEQKQKEQKRSRSRSRSKGYGLGD